MTPVSLHCSDSTLYLIHLWLECLYLQHLCTICWGRCTVCEAPHRLTFTQRSERGLGWFMAQRQLTCMIHALHLRFLSGTTLRHTCDSKFHYLPLANLPISHTFPIMFRTFQTLPSIPQKRSVMYRARSHRTKSQT